MWDNWNPNVSPLCDVFRESVKFVNEDILLHLPKSKNDQVRNGHALSPSEDLCGLIRALCSLFKQYPKADTQLQFGTSCGSFKKKLVANKLAEALLKAGLDPSTYSGHSFRRGTASTAVAAGIPRHGLKATGR